MNDYYFSQKYGGYAKEVIIPGPTMAEKGCAVTCCAMLLSYFNDRAMFPNDLLHWFHEHGGMMPDGRIIWTKICEAAGNKLRMSITPNPHLGEVVYGIREVWFKGQTGNQHFVLDHPRIPGKVIDPIDGSVKPFKNEHVYTGKNIFFIGIRT